MRSDLRFPALHILDHPLIQHKLSHMRMVDTDHQAFRQLLKEIAMLMGYEITRSLPITERSIQTPITQMHAQVLDGFRPVVVPILRAGLGMAEGLLELLPDSPVGHIGLYRDKITKMPVEYLVKLPPLQGREVILVDPMLATGHSAIYAVDVLKRHGVREDKVRFMVLVAAPEGVETFTKAQPQVKIFTAALDEKLNENAYIVPGLGDAGDRLYATK